MYSHAEPLGAWWNSINDLWGDVQNVAGKVVGGGSASPQPGWSARPPMPTPTPFTYPGTVPAPPFPPSAGEDNDLSTVRMWALYARMNKTVPTRLPPAMANVVTPTWQVGDLATRWSGPGTDDPSHGPPQVYLPAPDDVIAADRRITDRLAVDQIVPPDLLAQVTTAVKWVGIAALGLVGVMVLRRTS